MGRKLDNIIGQKFGRLTVIEALNIKKGDSIIHKCICDCGNIISIPKSYLMQGKYKSCGCLRRDIHKKHNLHNTRLYNIFYAIKKRCYNKNCDAYKDYGGRGIKICKEWEEDFLNFYNWAINNGYSKDLTIERIDVNGDYCPNNCTWIPRKEQPKNTRKNIFVTYKNKTQLLSDWSRELKIPKNTLSRRLKQYNNLDIVFYKGNLHKIIYKNGEQNA